MQELVVTIIWGSRQKTMLKMVPHYRPK